MPLFPQGLVAPSVILPMVGCHLPQEGRKRATYLQVSQLSATVHLSVGKTPSPVASEMSRRRGGDRLPSLLVDEPVLLTGWAVDTFEQCLGVPDLLICSFLAVGEEGRAVLVVQRSNEQVDAAIGEPCDERS